MAADEEDVVRHFEGLCIVVNVGRWSRRAFGCNSAYSHTESFVVQRDTRADAAWSHLLLRNPGMTWLVLLRAYPDTSYT